MTTQTIPVNELLVTEAYSLITQWLQSPDNVALLSPNATVTIGKLSTDLKVYILRTPKDELRVRVGGSSFETKYIGKWTKDITRISGGGRWWVDELTAKNNLRSLLRSAK